MRHFNEIMEYAQAAPEGEPVPITESEIPALSNWIQSSMRNHGSLKLGESIVEAAYMGRCQLVGHQVVVLP